MSNNDPPEEEHAGHHSQQSEQRADASEGRADKSEIRADKSSDRADVSEQRADVSEVRANVSEVRADKLEVDAAVLSERVDGNSLGVLALTERAIGVEEALIGVGEALSEERLWRKRFFGAFVVSTVVGLVLLATLMWLAVGNRQIGQTVRSNSAAIADCVEPEGDCFKADRKRDANLIRTIDQNNRCLVQDTINDLINGDPNAAEEGTQPIDITPGFDCNQDGRIDN